MPLESRAKTIPLHLKAERKELQAKLAATEAIRDRAGLAIELLDEIPEDAQRAKLVEFGPDYSQRIEKAHSRPLFRIPESAKKPLGHNSTGKTKAQISADATKEKLQSDLRQNTRARVDPFLVLDKPRPGLGLKLLKRKQADNSPVASNEVGGHDFRGLDSRMGKVPVVSSMGFVEPGVSLGLDGYESDDG